MKLEDGKEYVNRLGKCVIVKFRSFERYRKFPNFIFQDNYGDIYMEDGKFIAGGSHPKDLISESTSD